MVVVAVLMEWSGRLCNFIPIRGIRPIRGSLGPSAAGFFPALRKRKSPLLPSTGNRGLKGEGRLDFLFEEGQAGALIFHDGVAIGAGGSGSFGGTGEIEEFGHLAVRTGSFADVEVIGFGGFFGDDAECHGVRKRGAAVEGLNIKVG